ncbi:regulator of volume decrease after cellular swelling-domain-containing protein [Xylaria bambusicola]|uniref:regulator of volume decrease after cellular swelling-domain-containing protein n=1 Tax=Xylaria bambusicola TaxID=326684 RepID=UPI002007A673|nr:regulator of volume decrease after cellular swelling-domain-containing protein [Xylaria bambusicola]KAI0525483.1 regulator of volume decrease after cellular swelling-domain-containing protein [Xylaria bambusicola]
MLPVVIQKCPSAENDFLPLSEYQSQTPETFFEGKPVLYFHDESIKAWVSNEKLEELFFFSQNSASEPTSLKPTPPESHALDSEDKHTCEENKVEVFVSSRKLILFSHNSGKGIEIPYPTVTLHAIKNFKLLDKSDDDSQSKFSGVYMQLEFSNSAPDDDESFEPIELTLIPYKPSSSDEVHAALDPLNAERTSALFNQISACSNLNPDPRNEGEEDDEDDEFNADHIVFEGNVDEGVAIEGLPGVLQGNNTGGLPPPMPGSSGWITADNVNEYFDEEGNWIGDNGVSGELGDGAGRVRGRDEVEQDGKNGHEEVEDSDVKRPRTE